MPTTPGGHQAIIKDMDWPSIEADLNVYGCAVIPRLLATAECLALRDLYPRDDLFRSRHTLGIIFHDAVWPLYSTTIRCLAPANGSKRVPSCCAGFATARSAWLGAEVARIAQAAPFRHMARHMSAIDFDDRDLYT